jgi:light-regulated signal transduction histidine kinase (bacteriophytochrome)
VLAAADLGRLLSHRDDEGTTGLDALPVTTTHGGDARRWMALIHRHEGLAIVELEPVNAPHDGPSTTLLLGAASRRLQAAADLVQACQVVTEQVRRITGFARVNLYRFGADWSGEVLAESRDDDMPSYLGLHFPASDIPAQARALYQSNPVRLIADVRYTPAALVPDRNPTTDGPIDLRFATLRSVSPVHLEYLRNMGTGASMSASILRDGVLWGLIACHHREPLLVDFERRQACALLAQFLASRLDGQERVDRARRSVRVESLRVGMLRGLADGQSVHEAMDGHAGDWTRLVGADGFALLRPDRLVLAGAAPAEAFVRRLGDWLSDTAIADHAAIDRLSAIFPDADAEASVASGVLAVPLSRSERSWLLWFRPEFLRAVTWAGKPAKTEVALPEGTALHPRLSFDAWTEEVRGRSLPWTEQDIAAALQLREMLLDLMVREKDELERRNIKLALSSRELETFIYVASHDIKEPLRQMEMLASLLREHVRDEAPSEVADYFREFKTVANRLRALTDQLANYAKLGRTEARVMPVALDELLEEVLAGLRHAIDDADGDIVVQRHLPIVSGEREQLHQVFVNLIGNSLKYRATDRRPRITICGETAKPDAATMDAGSTRRMSTIVVADNGIGFDARFGEKVFDAFVRLHSRDRYEGSGIGLAICRRIVERHGGRIEATAVPDAGATFTFTLPPAS